MEKINRYWKPITTGLGVSVAGVFMYLLYRRFLKGKLSLPFGGGREKIPTALEKSEAMLRSSLVKNLKYTLYLQLRADSILATKNVYEGAILIQFDLNKIEEIFLDFKGHIERIIVNSEEIKVEHKNNKVYLPKDKLTLQSNNVHITFTNHYTNTHTGIRYWTDPDDEVK
jgi:hypothetical protein